jgi:hypothetical protein
LYDIISHSFSRLISFWHRLKLTTSILHMSVVASRRGSWYVRGRRTNAGEGLARLDSGSLTAGFFLLCKKISKKKHHQ